MERRKEEWGMIIALIEALVDTREIEVESVNKALQEIQDRIIDIRLDNPFVDQALAEFFYPQLSLIAKVDNRST
ncbi:hypothetical protein GNI_184950 [Gregarina niphandrodes]|uniref:Uncharacterized protein n=1 Tax=Gregarina niphandrodes TaxID=110365 RepID=A0A023AWM9_GRENI|nr:hypothetical protein GNI_184950 [Gregarina niphandrodes]EZG43146.1 hypothetical protein GNI_184950 [Gregarina niphandrodes]|eukprot:XP_011133595.1 hypothetical protein GNI_184950 [Gregarina niphandrodes]